MVVYDKLEVRSSLSLDDIFQFLVEWGGSPEYTDFGITATTICHNMPGQGSRKLYYYRNTDLFSCWTGCGSSFDIFELYTKVTRIQEGREIDLNEAVRYIAFKCGIAGTYQQGTQGELLDDWKILENYDRIQELELKIKNVELKEYDDSILDKFNYNTDINPWYQDNITQEVIKFARIGYYPGGGQITIPHYDAEGRFVGLRGRTLGYEEAQLYGKYRPLRIHKELYSHPLGLNLYGLNWAKDNINKIGKAIVFESEKSVLQYMSYFGVDNCIAVACCGSNLSNYQMELLQRYGAKEIIIAFDRQWNETNDDEHKHLVKNLTKIHNKYIKDVQISFIFDKNKITPYKSSPTDCGRYVFLKLFKERVLL